MNKSEELIACLEGEIAKRDEELAACRVAVENCEVFRARIAELERQLNSDKLIKMVTELREELAAIKAQGVVIDADEAANTLNRAANIEEVFEDLCDDSAVYQVPKEGSDVLLELILNEVNRQ